MDTNLGQITMNGYEAKGHFVLPASDWTGEYYELLQASLEKMKRKYEHNTGAQQVIGMIESEISLYEKHGGEYSYVFFAMERKWI
ncbi:hypothetical protein [Alteribacter keqinensis]|uniref:hypothetical protein n=1 Tax=Alteribacter keqinensis TaxID=2483800 RepID=UPI000F0986A7|nr:hypothetical protein [Alteribacter keqinensis]